MDLFGSQPSATSSPAPQSSILGTMGDVSSPPPQQQQAAAGVPCYNANGLNVTFQLQRNAEGTIQATARFQNLSSDTLTNVGLQAAVPKSQKLQLQSISSSELAPASEASQVMRVSGCKGVSFFSSLAMCSSTDPVQPLRLRLRIGYNHPSAGQVMEQVNWTEPS
jgi:AP-1 complex subunit gamma-1